GLGRGAFYANRVGDFGRVQADGEHLPFADASFDLTFCVATLHHALDLRAMVREMARVTQPRGVVAALNEGTRAVGASADAPLQREERSLGINEHVHTVWSYVWSFVSARVVVERALPADGNFAFPDRASRALLRLPRGGRTLATLKDATGREYGGVTLFGRRLTARQPSGRPAARTTPRRAATKKPPPPPGTPRRSTSAGRPPKEGRRSARAAPGARAR